MQYSELIEKKLSSEKIYGGRIINLYNDAVLLPDGKQASREYVTHPGGVCIVALTDDGRVIVERQFRYPYNDVLLEIPAGKLDSKTEDHESAARRELLEETGASADEMIYLGKFYPTCGYTDEIIYMYFAKGLSFGERDLDEDEFLSTELVPLDELVSEIMKGNVPDGKTQAAVLRVYSMLKNNER